MELKQISERIYFMPAEPITDRPVLGYIKGDKYSLMIDAYDYSIPREVRLKSKLQILYLKIL